ncbi:unnamed protein product [Meloidogyne enterolobii]|uniref:Uncharacterized protein n=3 Tax=Meloidogyne TaxID=189290 RepID=A0A6V7X7D2_MELEN|nr:unnamed protein product [Meloidogyne enterolobii]CAD2202646.1 unnamed protein product [Meloidogyne enterolobii]CAD2203849.1 unnamed protein product [Meloidogyne enterolobii]
MSSEDEININAIEKQFWAAKETVKVKDLEKCHSDVIKLEEGVNRALRLINRKANTNYEKINTMAKDVNLNIKTLSTQIISLSENVERLEALKSDTLGPNNSLLADSNLDETQKESINMISSHSGHVETFSDESIIAYDKWAEKFCDYVGATGRAWTEPEKVARLKLALSDTPRQLFKQLTQQETSTLESALKALRSKLDSPQRREITKRTLACCKQRETETVSEFLKRLTPLVEVVNSSLDETQRKEKICEEFLDRVKPNIGFLIRLVGLSKAKDLDLVKSQAEELETMLASDKGQIQLQSPFTQTVHALATNPTMPSSSYSMPPRSFPNQNTLRRNYPNANFTPLSTQNTRYIPNRQNRNNRNDSWRGGQQQRNERKWNNRPICNFCKRVGHTSYTCQERLARFQINYAANSHKYNTQQAKQPVTGQIRSIEPSNKILIDAGDLIHALAKLGVGNNHDSSPLSKDANSSVNSLATVDKIPNKPIKEEFKQNIENKVGKEEIHTKISSWEGIAPKISRMMFYLTIMLILVTPINGSKNLIPIPRQPIIC